MDRTQLFFSKLEIIDDVPSRDDERVQMHDGKFVADGESQVIFGDDRIRPEFTKRTSFGVHENPNAVRSAAPQCAPPTGYSVALLHVSNAVYA